MHTNNRDFAGNKSFYYDQQRKIVASIFPGTETWSFLAKPKARLLKDLMEELVYIFSKEKVEDYF